MITKQDVLRSAPVSAGDVPFLEKALAVAVVVLIGTRVELPFHLAVGSVAALVLLPVWARIPARFVGAVPLLALMPVVVVIGAAITFIREVDHPAFRDQIVSHSAILIGLAGALGGLLWCRYVMGSGLTAIAFGAGLVVGIPMNISANANQWRFTYSIPIAVLLLALVSYGRARLGPQLLVCVGLAVVGLLNDSRSNSAMLLLAAAIVIWQTIDHHVRRGRGGSVMLVAWGVTIYFFVRSTILNGYFGDAALARTQEQIVRGGGNLLLGGRPEIAASADLVTNYPLGLGSGIGATYDDIVSAKDAMSRIGYDAANNGYVDSFMFGRGIEVHSGIGDLWIWFGLGGVALAATLLWLVIRGVQAAYDQQVLTVLTAYLATRFLWDLGFSPVLSGISLLGLCVALFLRRRDDEPGGHLGDDLRDDRVAQPATSGEVRVENRR